MLGLPDFVPPPNDGFSVDKAILHKFKQSTAHMPRRIQLYTAPLLIVPESPGSRRFSPKSWVLRETTVFSKSYYGFSAAGSDEANSIIAILHLITHCDLFRYHVLMTSSRMAAERRTFLKESIEKFPFPAPDQLSQSQRRRAEELSTQLETASSRPRDTIDAIDDFIFNLYGLDQFDRQVVEDTLTVASPFKESRDQANSLPDEHDRSVFYSELCQLLAPSFDLTNETVSIDEVRIEKQGFSSPWHFFSISSPFASTTLTPTAQKQLISQITREADKTGSSRVIVHEKGRLLVGIIGQYRYWTLSRARLCALDILRYHLDAFPIRKN